MIFFEDFSNDTSASIVQRYPNSKRSLVGPDMVGWPIIKDAGTASTSDSILTGNPYVGKTLDRLEIVIDFADNGDRTGFVDGTMSLALFNLVSVATTATSISFGGNPASAIQYDIDPKTIHNMHLDVDFANGKFTVFINGNLALLREDIRWKNVLSTDVLHTSSIIRVFGGNASARQSNMPNFITRIIAVANNPVGEMLDASTLSIERTALVFSEQTDMEYSGNGFVEDVDKSDPLDGDTTVYAISLGSITYNRSPVADPSKLLGERVYVGARTDTEQAIDVVGGDYFIPGRALMAYLPMEVVGDQIKIEVVERKAFKALLDVTAATSLSPRFVGGQDIVIDWGDGTATEVGSAARADHAYNTPGQYVVQITGKCKDLTFAHPMFVELLDWGENLEYEHVQFWKDIASSDPEIRSEGLVKIAEGLPKSVTSMNYTFKGCSSLTTIPLLDTSNVTDMRNVFWDCSSLTTIPLLDTSKVTSMSTIFYGCSSLTTIPLLDTSNVISMSYMFYGCSSLTTIPLLDTSKVTNMNAMFRDCSSLTSDLSKWCVTLIKTKPSNFDTNVPTDKGYKSPVWGTCPAPP